MQFKQLIALTYAITAAGLAIGLTSDYTRSLHDQYGKYIEAQQTVPKPEVEMSSVLTVAREVPFGHKLSAADFKVTAWPAGAVPPGALRTLDEVFSGSGEKYAKAGMVAGEVVVPAKISDSGNGSALSMLLPKGMRAVTIQINEVRGVGGFVQPNDTVDVILTEMREEDKKEKAVASRVILQNIRVLAMGQDVRRLEAQPKVVRSATVAVTLEDAQKLALATSIGQISLALRNPEQTTISGMREVSVKDLQKPNAEALRSGRMEVVVHRMIGQPGEPEKLVRERRTY